MQAEIDERKPQARMRHKTGRRLMKYRVRGGFWQSCVLGGHDLSLVRGWRTGRCLAQQPLARVSCWGGPCLDFKAFSLAVGGPRHVPSSAHCSATGTGLGLAVAHAHHGTLAG